MLKRDMPISRFFPSIRRAPSSATLALVVIASFPTASPFLPAADRPGDAMDRRVVLDVWGEDVTRVGREILAQTEVRILTYNPDFAPGKLASPLRLVSGEISLRQAAECLARLLGCRYRESEGSIELSTGYAWVPEEFKVRFYELDTLAGPDGVAGLERELGEFLRALPLLPDGFAFSIEAVPGTAGRTSHRGVAVLPPTLADYLDRVVECLGGGANNHRQIMAPPPSAAPVMPWPDLLTRETETASGGWSLRDAARDIARNHNLVLAFAGPYPINGGDPAAAWPGGRTSLGSQLALLAARSGNGTRVLGTPGVALFIHGRDGIETDSATREYHWSGLETAGFDLSRFADPPGVAERIRREVAPGLWRDPVCAVGTCGVTKRLAVVAPAWAVAKVADWLAGAEAAAVSRFGK